MSSRSLRSPRSKSPVPPRSPKLPKNLNDIINDYKYKENIKGKNSLARNKLILEELENIDIDEIIQFKLARQLAINYVKINKKIKNRYNNVDISSLTGICSSPSKYPSSCPIFLGSNNCS